MHRFIGRDAERLPDCDLEEAPSDAARGGRVAMFAQHRVDERPIPTAGSREPQRIFESSFDHLLWGSPAWAPECQRLAFRCNAGAIWIIDNDGRGLETLIDIETLGDALPQARDPDWSPGSSTIVFTCGLRLYTVRSDGTNLVELPGPREEDFGQLADFEPAWSPNRSLIAFIGFTPLLDFGLLVMEAKGASRRALFTPFGAFPSDPVWSRMALGSPSSAIRRAD